MTYLLFALAVIFGTSSLIVIAIVTYYWSRPWQPHEF